MRCEQLAQGYCLIAQPGFEPTTVELQVECSTTWLLTSMWSTSLRTDCLINITSMYGAKYFDVQVC